MYNQTTSHSQLQHIQKYVLYNEEEQTRYI